MPKMNVSVLISRPGWEPSLGGLPALSAMPGQFLLKDVVPTGGGPVQDGRGTGGGPRWPIRRAGLSQMILVEGGGLRIPFGRRLRKLMPLALALFVRAVCRIEKRPAGDIMWAIVRRSRFTLGHRPCLS